MNILTVDLQFLSNFIPDYNFMVYVHVFDVSRIVQFRPVFNTLYELYIVYLSIHIEEDLRTLTFRMSGSKYDKAVLK